jgi:hypothetical protein
LLASGPQQPLDREETGQENRIELKDRWGTKTALVSTETSLLYNVTQGSVAKHMLFTSKLHLNPSVLTLQLPR